MKKFNARKGNKMVSNRDRKIMNAGIHLVERIHEYAEVSDLRHEAYIDIHYIGVNWVGSYGRIGELNMGTREIIWDDCLASWNEEKKAANLIAKKNNKIFFKADNDYINSIIIFSADSSIGFYGKYNTTVITMENGQLFDADNMHWFNVQDSKELSEDLRRGYNYYDPQRFYQDSDDSKQMSTLQSDLSKHQVEKYKGGEWIGLGKLTVNEFWDIIKVGQHIKVGNVVYTLNGYYHTLLRDDYDPDYRHYEGEEL